MINKVYGSPGAAVADIFDGAVIMVGGFVSAGSPTNLLEALARQGARRLTAIANNVGLGDRLDLLAETGQLVRFIGSFAIRASGARESCFERRLRAGEAQLELVPQGTLAERIRASGAGIAGFLTPTGVGTVVAEGKQILTLEDRQYLLERPLHADFALLKAHKADRLGNLVYRGAGRNFNAIMATAADVVIVEVEEIVERGQLDPERVDTPCVYVDRVVQCPPVPIRWEGG